jgi:hypothetical protein
MWSTMFRRTIAIVDLKSGRVSDRTSNTLTLDVPADFDRSACLASVDARSQAHYLSTAGTTLLNSAHPRPLSWRVRGEECLVARARGNADGIGYRLCAVDPAPG